MILPLLPALTLTIEVKNPGALDGPGDPRQSVENAAYMGAQWLQGQWMRLATAANIRGSSGKGTSYINGIQDAGSLVRVSGEGAMSGDEVVQYEVIYDIVNTSEHASFVDYGHDAFHLPSVMTWDTPSVKRSKDGTPYINIPLQHRHYQAPGKRGPGGATLSTRRAMMPAEVYNQAKRLDYRQKTNAGAQFDGNGQFMAADRYKWRGSSTNKRIKRGHVKPDTWAQDSAGAHEMFQERRGSRVVYDRSGKSIGTNPAWKSSKYEGLFRTGAPRQASYLTIRTITPKSEGWHIPAVPGLHIVDQVHALARGAEFQALMALQLGATGRLSGAGTPGGAE